MVKSKSKNKDGFALIEIVIAIGLFSVISYAVYLAYANVMEAISKNQYRLDALDILQNEVEKIKNMPYQDVGLTDGLPQGTLLATKTINSGTNDFILTTHIRNYDDPFDGTVGGTPDDSAPADYKIAQLDISCSNCISPLSMTMTTTIAPPQGLETMTNNGSLFINVFDANGQPISGANVSVINNSLSPAVSINDTTNNAGVLQLVDISTSTSAYQISVSKGGYSSERTYAIGGAGNPNPVKPHSTVASQQVTSVSFAIDKTSTVNVSTVDKMCAVVPGVSFLQEGAKLIGTDPDVLKYSKSFETDSAGEKNISGLEWDTYNFTNTAASYDLAGGAPYLPLTVNPNNIYALRLTVEPKNSPAFLITVVDEDGSAINGVNVNLAKVGFDETLTTGRNNFSQTDWSGNNFDSQSGGIETTVNPGNIGLTDLGGGTYSTSTQWLVSKTFDLGVNDTSFYELLWSPQNQPPQTGNASVSFQVAANNDNALWDFVGPDGTASSFYTLSGAQLHSSHNGKRYLRYKAYLKTENENFTPNLDWVKINFSSGCLAAGQVYFGGLSIGTYTITVTKSGYQDYIDSSVAVLNAWGEYRVNMARE